ncbi:glutaminyl-peptide cyclotransferase [Dyella psychrodurans]|uniref:Glutaminyl-peptide cyclotransferase n=1 Tax=Dyella psychrodurans TaxID=1927960 RepID=A0A370X6Y6_9GAMM|nr:glutaminyl-peptide cyclotransferase [Dyella psychrodurans]RDS84011.1 glutaminyl-peptide cyclotransferase [Dyella psychrodurans]
MKPITFSLALLLLCCASIASAQDSVPVYGYKVVHTYPHDTGAYTEGFFYLDGNFYEATGEVGHSSVRKVDINTGKVLQKVDLPPPDYGEGIVAWKNRLIELTWQSQHGFIYDLHTFKQIGKFDYPGEGWALTEDSKHIYMSDGTPTIRVLDPNTLKQTGKIDVTADGKPLVNLNELEWVKGKIYANVWLTHAIVQIDPATGKVVGVINLTGLGPNPADLTDPSNDVLNGIAYDAKHDRLFVTGKRWPLIYEIQLTPPQTGSK